MDHEAQSGGTHTQFNEVFTDNSNCQILVPNDIVQNADAHNPPLSLSKLPAPVLVKQADLISGKNLLGGKKRLRGPASEGHGFYPKGKQSSVVRIGAQRAPRH